MKISKRIMSIGLITVVLGGMLVGCDDVEDYPPKESKEETEVNENVDVEEDNDTEESKPEEKIIPVGEEIVFHDENGDDMFSIKINSVTIADNFITKKDETFSAEPDRGVFESDYEQAVELNYTYSNIGMDEKLEITSFDLQVADSEGEVSESVGVLKKPSEEIVPNTSFTADSHYALMNKSDKVKIIFSSNLNPEPLIFEAPVIEEA